MSSTLADQTVHIVRLSIEQHQAAIRDLESQVEILGRIATVIAKAIREGGKLIAYGNGGSAADSQHLVAEFVGRFTVDRPPLPAISLTANIANLTAIANDYSYDEVFTRQLEALGAPGDVALGISTSGNSPNVLAASRRAKELGLVAVGLTGRGGGELRGLVEHCVCVGTSTPRTQEAHLTAIHIVSSLVEENLIASGYLPNRDR